MKLLVIGDVVGKAGRRAIQEFLPGLRSELAADVVVANGENLAGGSGITVDTAEDMFSAGVDALTGGNHLFDRREALDLVAADPRVVRPANYPPGVPGSSLCLLPTPGGPLAVGCVLGRVFMRPLDDPFRASDVLIDEASRAGARHVLVDVHAEASSEKMALGWYLDGRASAVLGSHTHVPTADDRILPGGTAYVTDVGMTGPYDSIIGMEKEPVLTQFTTGINQRFKPATGDVRLLGVLVELDDDTGRARSIRRVGRRFEETGT